jgi:hypothetical protein
MRERFSVTARERARIHFSAADMTEKLTVELEALAREVR